MFAQAWKSDNQYILLGVGENVYYETDLDERVSQATSQLPVNYGSISYRNTPAFFGKLEYALSKHIGASIVVGYRKTEVSQERDYIVIVGTPTVTPNYTTYNYYFYKDRYTYYFSDASFGLRFNIHFIEHKFLDPYIGFSSGYRLIDTSYDQKSTDPNASKYILQFERQKPVYLAATIGLRCFLTKQLGIYLEAGLDKFSIIQGGLTFKLKNSPDKKPL